MTLRKNGSMVSSRVRDIRYINILLTEATERQASEWHLIKTKQETGCLMGCPPIMAYMHTLHYITLHYITLHYITVQYGTVHYLTLHYITWHYITLHYMTLHDITIHYLTLPYLTLPCLTLHYITLPYITLHTCIKKIYNTFYYHRRWKNRTPLLT